MIQFYHHQPAFRLRSNFILHCIPVISTVCHFQYDICWAIDTDFNLESLVAFVPVTAALQFTLAELKTAACSLKNERAFEPDGIRTEVIKEIAQHCTDMLLEMYNSCLKEGIFPDAWKERKLALISKDKGEGRSPSHIDLYVFWTLWVNFTKGS